MGVPASATTRSGDPSEPVADRGHDVLLGDGRRAVVRPLDRSDLPAVTALHTGLDTTDRHFRYLSASAADPRRTARSVLAPTGHAVGVFEAGELLGVAHYVPVPDGSTAEFAVLVASAARHRGAGTLLMEALAGAATAAGLATLTGEVASDNAPMMRVLTDLGRPLRTRPDGPVTHVRLETGDPTPLSDDPHWSRVSAASAISLTPVLAPASVAVVGASRRPGTVGRAVLDRIRRGGFSGPLAVVNPRGTPAPDLPWAGTVGELGTVPDLAVLCVPADAVVPVAEDCGRAGVGALLVLTSGVTGADAGRLAAVCAHHRMRLVGPNCLGLVDTAPGVALDATFAATAPAGEIGVAAQSGGIAVALGHELAAAGLGISSLVSTGDALDVAADDLLAWWAHDGRTRGAVLYLESARRPHEFAAVARRAARTMPVVVIPSGSSDAGRRAAASHTAATATPRTARDALYRQAGLLLARDPREAVQMLATLQSAPLPAGPRVGIVSNAGGLGVLAADACTDAGLQVARMEAGTRFALAGILPATAAVGGPVDTTAVVGARAFARAVTVVAHDPGVDAVVVTGVPTDLGDPLAEIGDAAGEPVPVVVVAPGGSRPRDRVPVHDDVTSAAAAVAAGVRRGHWLRHAADPVPALLRTDTTRAHAAVAGAGEGWLDPLGVLELLGAAGIPAAPVGRVRTADGAVQRWRAAGGPVALKAEATGLLHKAAAGGVVLDVDSEDGVRAAVGRFAARFGDTLRGVLVQPMVSGGDEVLVGATVDAVVGPVLTVGPGGSATDAVGGRSHLLAVASPDDADGAVADSALGPRLAAQGRAAVRDVLLRWGWLVRTVPRVVEAEINPLVLRPDCGGGVGATAVDARIRLRG